jgi:signal transduction histidine kinase
MEIVQKYDELVTQIEELQSRLNEAEDTLEAIRRGEVDAFVVKNGDEHELYTLKSADHTYRVFIEQMTEGAVTLNKEGIVLYSNSSFAEMIDTPLSKVLGFSFTNFIPAEFRDAIDELISSGWLQESKAEINLCGKQNKKLPVLLSVNTLEIDGGEALSILITDLSFQKETMEQKKAMEKKDEFISIASHELKTPVTSIKGYVQLLRSTFFAEGNTNAVELLTKADAQINKLSTLVNDLLDVKKMENGQLQYHQEYFDFNELVTEVVEETGRVITKHTIHSEVNTSCKIYGDRNKLCQVIINFIDNAAKYSPPHTDIIIKAYDKNNKVKLSVQDFGMGIPKDQQSRIFERFFRVYSEKVNTYAGLGLGLYISAEIIKRHKGSIGVESEKGKGATFYFEIPCLQLTG